MYFPQDMAENDVHSWLVLFERLTCEKLFGGKKVDSYLLNKCVPQLSVCMLKVSGAWESAQSCGLIFKTAPMPLPLTMPLQSQDLAETQLDLDPALTEEDSSR